MSDCILCGQPLPGESFLSLSGMPSCAQNIPDKDSLHKDSGMDLNLFQCHSCGLVQLNCAPVPYYRDVIRAGGGTKTMTDLRKAQYAHFIDKCHLAGKRILEVGAGTGRYSVALAKEGYSVVALELIERNLSILKSKLTGDEQLQALQGNALDLSRFADDSFDLTLVLGPMYHLYTKDEKLRALSEAVRVTKTGGFIMVAYCMNEPTVINYVFGQNKLWETLDADMLTKDWHCISEPKDVFELVRIEDIAELDGAVDVKRMKLIAADGATNYMRTLIDGMDEATFSKWVEYHLSICERQDLIGASHHTLDILQKK